MNWKDYVAQAQLILETSANLTIEQKIKAEFYDNKFISIGRSVVFEITNRNMSLH